MKRILSFIAITVASVVIMIVGQAQEHKALLYIGVVIGGLVGLAIIVYLAKFLCRTIGSSITSTVFLIACGVVVTVLIAQGIISTAVAYPTGIFLGFMLSASIIRAIAKRAESSFLFGDMFAWVTSYEIRAYIRDMFAWVTSYEIRAYIRHGTLTPKAEAINEHDDYKNLVHVLKRSLGLSKIDAEKAAEYAVMITPINASIEDKLQSALQYHGKSN